MPAGSSDPSIWSQPVAPEPSFPIKPHPTGAICRDAGTPADVPDSTAAPPPCARRSPRPQHLLGRVGVEEPETPSWSHGQVFQRLEARGERDNYGLTAPTARRGDAAQLARIMAIGSRWRFSDVLGVRSESQTPEYDTEASEVHDHREKIPFLPCEQRLSCKYWRTRDDWSLSKQECRNGQTRSDQVFLCWCQIPPEVEFENTEWRLLQLRTAWRTRWAVT